MSRVVLLLLGAAAAVGSCAAESGPDGGPDYLHLEKIVWLPDTAGRIDHLAYDPHRRRLFVAELGNRSIDEIDLASGNVARRISGLGEPQGVAWLGNVGELAVASGDGRVRFYAGDDLRLVSDLNLGGDADNLRVDPRSGLLTVGYGAGAIAEIDPVRHAVVRQLALPAHPEGFRLDGDKVYVNLPDARAIAVGNLASGSLTARWPTGLRLLNFPMALDPAAQRLAVAFRLPARLAIVDARSGAYRQTLETCGDSDDLFFDDRRSRLYVVCGSGSVDVFAARDGAYARLGRTPTRAGARTGLFVPEEDRLYVAARARGGDEAAILILRPDR